MADIIKNEFNINANFSENTETLLFNSASQLLNGKITSISLDLIVKSISVSRFLMANSDVIIRSGSGFEEQDIDCGKQYVENQKILTHTVRKVYSGSKLANNGNCDFSVLIKASNNLSGTVKGTIMVYTTEDEEEQEAETILGLNQSALNDWFKSQSSSNVKTGVPSTVQYPIEFQFKSGKSQNLIWTNKGVNSDYIENLSVSLSLFFENEANAQRVVDLDFNVAYGSESETDNIGMWILPAGQTRTENVARTYDADDFVNDGFCVVTLTLKNTENVKGTAKGVIILNTVSAGASETGNSVTDTSIQNVLDMLNDDGYSVGGASSDSDLNIDSFLSSYTGEGYEDDMSLLSSDSWNTQSISNDLAGKILELEQRITNLEERMNILNVGGTDIDWYDGGGDGSDDVWGIDEWYKQNADRITQTEQEGNVSHTLFTNVTSFDEVFFQTGDYSSLSEAMQNFNYYLLLSYRYKGELCDGKKFALAINVKSENEEKDVPLGEFEILADGEVKTSDFKGSLTQEELLSDGNCLIKGIAYFSDELTQEEQEDIIVNFECKVSGNIDYQLQEQKAEEKVKDKNELTVEIDTEHFTGSQTIFSYDAQSRNENLQKVEITLTLAYNYDITQSQACVGQKLKLDFNTVAVHPGFYNQVTYFNIGIDEITSSEKNSKQKVYKATYTLNQFANNGNCAFSVDFVTPDISSANLADFKQNFEGTVTGTVKYTVLSN